MRYLTRQLVSVFAYLCVLWILTYDGPPLQIVVWHKVSRMSQRVAYLVGRFGLYAEAKYHRSVSVNG